MDELDNFRSAVSESKKEEELGTSLELLTLEQGELAFAIRAEVVDSVVPWQAPAALPKAARHVHGIIQDRGRLVTVRKPELEGAKARRIVLCKTSRGMIGLPATSTRSVGTVVVKGALKLGTPIDTDRGALTILDSEELAREMTQE